MAERRTTSTKQIRKTEILKEVHTTTTTSTNEILNEFLNETSEIDFDLLEELRIFEEYLENETDRDYHNPIMCAEVILNKHGVLIYKCNLCRSTGQEFVNVANYQQHLKTNHGNNNTEQQHTKDSEREDLFYLNDFESGASLWLNELNRNDKFNHQRHSEDCWEQLEKDHAMDGITKSTLIKLEEENSNQNRYFSEGDTKVLQSPDWNILESLVTESSPQKKKRKRTPGYCELCNRSFNDLYNLRVHMMTHTGEKPYQCEECGKRFRQFNKLQIHRIIHTNAKPFICDICNKGFRFRNYLSVHKRLHSGEKPYKCKHCDDYFHSLHTRLQHMKTKHNSSEMLSCEKCNQIFTSPCYLKSHMKRHNNERDHHCDLCGSCFFSFSQLKDHKLCHTDWKPFECDICKAKFQRKSNFNQHLKIHSSEKNYVCQICGKAFSQNAGLYGHMKSHHKNY